MARTLASTWSAALISATLGILAGASTEARADPASEDATNCTDDAMIVFDASGSMASVGYNEMDVPRIFEAKEAVRAVLPGVTKVRRIGLTVYGPGPKDGCSNIDLRIAPAYDTAGEIMAILEATTPDGDTPLTRAVEAAAEAMSFREKPAVIVLVTDGDETCGGSPCELARQLEARGVATTVHVIGFKVRDRFFQWQSQASASDRPTMAAQCLADVTGGRFVTAETTDQLVRALQETLGCPATTERRGPAAATALPRGG